MIILEVIANELKCIVVFEKTSSLPLGGNITKKRFTRGRRCARKALEFYGYVEDFDILKDSSGGPIWPEDYVGSISHCDNGSVAAVGRIKDISKIGIDVAHLSVLNKKDYSTFLSEAELALMEAIPGDFQSIAAHILFSFKESCFKAFSKDNLFSDFTKVHLQFAFDSSLKVSCVLPLKMPTLLRYSIFDNQVFTICSIIN